MIILKATKNQDLTLSLSLSLCLSVCLSLSLQDTFLEKLPGTGQIDPPAF